MQFQQVRSDRFFPLFALVLVASVGTSIVQADYIALSRTGAAPTGSQNLGTALTLGEDFRVGSQTISVTQLGVFDSGEATIPSDSPLSVEIFDNSDHSLKVGPVSIYWSSTDPMSSSTGAEYSGGYVYVPIVPVTLQANHSYRLVAWGFDTANPNGNVNSGDAAPVGDPDSTHLISFPATHTDGNSHTTNSYYNYDGTSGLYPTTADDLNSTNVNLYSAGSFQFTPEPTSWSIAAVGILAACRRKRS